MKESALYQRRDEALKMLQEVQSATRMRVMTRMSANHFAVEGYHQCVEEAIRRTPEFLHSTTREEIAAPGNLLAVGLVGQRVCGGALAVPNVLHRKNRYTIKGLCNIGLPRGSAEELLKHLLNSVWALSPNRVVNLNALVRVLPDGSLNHRAARVFSGQGFVPQRILSMEVDGDGSGWNLLSSLESDGSYRACQFERTLTRLRCVDLGRID